MQISALSLFLYAGSAQFLFYSLAQQGADLLQIALGVGFINIRYLLINTYMAPFFAHSSFFEKLIGGFFTTDETFGVAAQYARKNKGILPFQWLLGLNLTAYLNWLLACLMGALFVSLLPEWLREGLKFSLIGMFVGLLLLGWYASQTRKIDIIVVAVAMLFMTFSRGWLASNPATILATLLAATVGFVILSYGKGAKRE